MRASVAWSGEPEVQKRDRGARGVVAGTVGVPVQAVGAVQILSYVLVGLQAGVAAVAHERARGSSGSPPPRFRGRRPLRGCCLSSP